jgi:hypothetical protein
MKIHGQRRIGMYNRAMRLYPAPVKTVKGTYWGYLNKKGEFAINPTFDYAMDFQLNGMAIVEKNNHYGLINEFGKYVVSPQYDSISDFSEGRAIVTKDDGFYVMNEQGKLLNTKPYSYIGGYQNSRAIFSEVKDTDTLYGYLNLKGKEVIKAQYKSASDFQNQKAIVQSKDDIYSLIDQQGKQVRTYPYPFVGNQGDGLLAFKEKPEFDAKYGVMDLTGKVIIPPTYSAIQPFQDGVSVVNISDDYKNKVGLIDKRGNYVIKPNYNDINLLKEGRVAIGKAMNEEEPYRGSKYAIATMDGALLTDFNFTQVLPFERGYASASGGSSTFFINRSGKMVTTLPVLSGSGTLSFEGDIIKAFIDQRISYYTKDGKLVWKQNRVIPLSRNFKVIEKKYKPNDNDLVYYPQVSGMDNENTEHKVNKKLKKLSMAKESGDQGDFTYSADFDIQFFKKDLLVLKLSGYLYHFGAAHGMPSLHYPHVDLNSGAFYQLEDLFKEDSDYIKEISNLIAEKIKTDEKYSYVFPDAITSIKPDQPFYVSDNSLYIYFEPYEIAPFVAGFPTFEIPYYQVNHLLNKEGAFWKAYH